MYTKFIIFLVICVNVISASDPVFRCYVCGFSVTDTDRSCLTVTNTTQMVECIHTYCTIMRQEFVDPPGVVSSFSRSCERQPAFLNHEVVDSTFRTFYRACTNDRCNVGDGIQSITGGNLSPNPPFDGSNLLVPGTRNGGSRFHINLFTIPLIIVACVLT